MDPVIAIAGRCVLACVFIGAAWHKWRHAGEFRRSLASYALLHGAAVPILAGVLPALELTVALGFLVPASSRFAAAAAAILLLSYSAAIAMNLARGRREIDCGCGGPPQSLSEWLLVRNGALLLIAWAAGAPHSGRVLHWPDWVFAACATAFGCLCYETGNQLLANAGRLKSLRRRHA